MRVTCTDRWDCRIKRKNWIVLEGNSISLTSGWRMPHATSGVKYQVWRMCISARFTSLRIHLECVALNLHLVHTYSALTVSVGSFVD